MRSVRRRLHRPTTLFSLAAIVLTVLAFGAPAARANTEPVDFSTLAAITAYLDSKGIGTSNLVVQEGTNNYYGSSCPSLEGWDCVTPAGADEVVVQLSYEGQNVYEPGDGTRPCVVVQRNETGANTATCGQINDASTFAFNALVAQENKDGPNESTISQHAELTEGATMSLEEASDVHQQIVGEGAGYNSSSIVQEIRQSSSLEAPATQTQVSSHSATVDQFSGSGSNYSHLTQSLYQDASIHGTGGEQHQNDAGEQEYMRNRVNQQSVSGTNESHLIASTEQTAFIGPPGIEEGPAAAAATEDPSPSPSPSETTDPVPGAAQLQGCSSCGIIGSLSQSSSGVSTATAELTEYQEASIDPSIPDATQVQYGPVEVPSGDVNLPGINGVRCCSEQSGNPLNTFDVTIASTQLSDAFGEQHNYVRAGCTTSGSCTTGVGVNQNGTETAETCTGTDCSTAVQCVEGETCQTADAAEPDTAITSGPSSPTSSESASFTFTTTEPGGAICALDEGAWEPCSSPKTYDGLLDGSHLFRVSAVDLAGNVDQTPAALTWLINSLVDTTIDSSPPTFTNKTTATLTFHGSDNAIAFECRLDSGAWEACSSPKSFGGLGVGMHIARVRAVDDRGRADASPDTAAWIVDLVKPSSIFTTRNGSIRMGAPFGDGTVAGMAFDERSGIERVELGFTTAGVLTRTAEATLSCNLNRTSCAWEANVFGLPPGAYTVTKQAFDRAGNSDTPSSVTIFVI